MAQLSVRIPQNLKHIMEKYVCMEAHKDISELTRDAIREKIHHDAPELYTQLFKESIS